MVTLGMCLLLLLLLCLLLMVRLMRLLVTIIIITPHTMIVIIITVVMPRRHQRPGCLSLVEQSESRIRFVIIITIRSRLWWRALSQLGHQTHVLLIDLIRTGRDSRLLRATVLGNVPGTATDRAQNVIRDIRLVRTEPTLVLRGSAVVAPWSISLSQGAIQLGQLP